jgi:predicted CXXCH cytochrome family protein
VHKGIRTPQHSLAGCIDCHADKGAQGQFLPVNAQDQFCQSCHAYAAVQIDCFSCHASVPAERISQSP